MKIFFNLLTSLSLFSCAGIKESKNSSADLENRNLKLVAISKAIPTIKMSGESESFDWVENKYGWPIIKASSPNGELLIFVDSGSGLTAVRENSKFHADLNAESRVDFNGAGSLGIISEFSIGNVKFENIGIHAFDKAADSTKELGFVCCDVLLGQNALQAVDVLFDKSKKKITFQSPADKKSSDRIPIVWKPELGNNWFSSVKINDQVCENARIDTGAAYQIKIYEPWYKSASRKTHLLEIAGKKLKVVPRLQKTPETAVNDKVCANIGLETLFAKPFYLSYKYNYGLWLK